MQLLAMLTMLIDHVGLVFWPKHWELRIVGRLAMPIYTYGIAQGFRFTRDRRRYLLRLVFLAAVSQLPFMFALNVLELNVVGTFAVSLGALMLMERIRSRLWLFGLIGAAALILLYFIPCDYGPYALLLLLIYQYMPRRLWIVSHLVLNVVNYLVLGDWLEMFSVFATVFLYYGDSWLSRLSVPRWCWRSWYPAHLSIIALILLLIGG